MISPRQGSPSPDHGQPAAARIEPWRQVPKINLLRSAEGRRGRISKSLRVGLFAVLVVEVLLAGIAYRNLSAVQEDMRGAQDELSAVGRQSEAVAATVQNLHRRIDERKLALGEERQEKSELTSSRVDWGASLMTLFGADVAPVTFNSVVVRPSASEVDVTGVALDVSAIIAFQSEIKDASLLLDLQSMRWEEGDSSLDLFATFKIRATGP